MFCKNCGSQVPDGIAFCAVCGTPVAGAEAAPAAAPAAPAAKGFKLDKDLLIKAVAGIAALALIVVLFAAFLGGGAKSAAKKYIMAQMEGDMKEMYSLSVGKYQKYIEDEVYKKSDDQENLFERYEEYGEEYDVDVKINNFNQLYKASKKIAKAENKETYGKGYKFSVKVVEVKEMRNSELEAIQERYDNDAMEDYINPDKIKKGKKVYVKIDIDSDEAPDSYIATAYVVKYGSQWKVASIAHYDDRNQEDD